MIDEIGTATEIVPAGSMMGYETLCDQCSPMSVCVSAQSDQGLHWAEFVRCFYLWAERAAATLDEELRDGWTEIKTTSAPQMDGCSCGLFVLMNAEATLHMGDTTRVDQDYVPQYRNYVGDRLLEAAVPYDDKVCALPYCDVPAVKTFEEAAFMEWDTCNYCGRWYHHSCSGIDETQSDMYRCYFCIR